MIRLLLMVMLLVPAMPALADNDHDLARRAVERGEVLPLARILEIARDRIGGRVIEVSFDRKHGRYLYEIEIVTDDGRLVELEIDGATGAVLDLEYEDD